MKHDLIISDASTNTVCAEVFDACWKTFNSTAWNFNPETDLLAIALGISQPRIDKHFKPILEWARTASDSQEFLQKMASPGFSSIEKKDYLKIIRSLLGKAKGSDLTNDELWKFLKCLVVLNFDLETAGSRDTTYCWNRLLTLTKGQDPNQAIVLFNELNSVVKDFCRSAGSISQQTLRNRIGPRVSLKDAPNFILDLVHLRKHTDLVLASINDTIGLKVKLPRTEKVDELETIVKENEVIIISDEPMTGKSALLKLFANRLRLEGEVIAFSVARFTGSSLSAFLQSIQITNDLPSILSAIGSAPLRCILIDGLERAKEEDKKRILDDLILSVEEYNKSILDAKGHPDNCWRILCTCRSSETQNILLHTQFRKNLATNTIKTIELGKLSKEEIAEVSEKFPMIVDLVLKDNLKEFMSRPLILDILTLPNITLSSKPLPHSMTESWLLDWYWKEIVRLGEGTRHGIGHPDQRESIMLSLAMESLDGETIHLVDINKDADAIAGLISDRLLTKEGNSLRFAHDVIEDWALAILLRYNEKKLLEFLLKFNDRLSLTRPFALYAAHLLEYERSSDSWFNLLKSLESEKSLSPRWRQSALTVPLTSPMLQDLLPTIEPYLYGNSALLCDFLKFTRTICVKPDPAVYSLLYGLSEEALEQYLAYWTVPIASQWIPIIDLLLEKQEIIKDVVLMEFSFICEKWMTRTINDPDQSLRKKLATFSLNILNKGLLQEYEDQPKNRYILSALFAANCLPAEISNFVQLKALRNRNGEILGFEDLILEQGWIPICRFLPEIALNLLEAILCINPRRDRFGYHDLFELGIRYSHWNPPTYLEGPFLVFLRMHEEKGLELINAVVNHATEVWKKREANDNRQPLPQVIKLEDKNIELWGDEHVYQWYRYPNVAPDAVTCALMALEYWMNEQIKDSKKTPKQLFEMILTNTKSLSVVGVCSSVALANINLCKESILPILENPAFWITDVYRLGQDLTSENTIKTFANAFSFNRSQEQNSYRILIELARQPHRRLDYRSFILPILLGNNEVLKDRLKKAVGNFPNKVPIFYDDEKDNTDFLKQRLDIFRLLPAMLDIENYETCEFDGKTVIRFKLPVELEREQRQQTEAIEKTNRLHSLLVWALSVLDNDRAASTSDLDCAFKLADELAQADDLNYQPTDFLEYSEMRAQAIAAFAAAVIVRHWQWIEDNNKVSWFRDQLLAAATRPLPLTHRNDAISVYPMGYRRSAARAICTLQQKINDKAIRKAIYSLSVNINNEVRGYLFNGLKGLWISDPKIIWECIDASIKEANIFHQKTRKIREFLPTEVDTDILMPVLYCIPTDNGINQTPEANKIIDLLEEMLLFTVISYGFYQEKENHYNRWEHNDWNQILFRTVANIGLRLPDNIAKAKLFDHILKNWIASLSMMTTFLRSLLAVGCTSELEDILARLWPTIGYNILSLRDSCYREDFSELAGLMIFADPHQIIIWTAKEWKPLRSLTPFIEKWCQEVGWYSQNFSSLIRLMKSVGFELFVDYGINWLFECLSRIDNEEMALEKISVSLSELLSNGWLKYNDAIKRDHERMRRFVSMVDKLANHGDHSAIRLQSKLLGQYS